MCTSKKKKLRSSGREMYVSNIRGELENLVEKNDDLLLPLGREKIAD